MMADLMHICAHEGISWEQLVARSRAQFVQAEAQSDQAAIDPSP
jgi:hypothetical protein